MTFRSSSGRRGGRGPLPVLSLLIAVELLRLPTVAHAHALGAEVRLKDGMVHVEAYFDDDSPAADARMRVENEAKELVTEGRADKKGHWTFPAPPAGKYRVLIDGGDGHRASIRLNIPGGGGGAAKGETTSRAAPAPTDKSSGAVVSEGATRQQFTSVPWARIALGFVVIGAVALLLIFALRKGADASREGA